MPSAKLKLDELHNSDFITDQELLGWLELATDLSRGMAYALHECGPAIQEILSYTKVQNPQKKDWDPRRESKVVARKIGGKIARGMESQLYVARELMAVKAIVMDTYIKQTATYRKKNAKQGLIVGGKAQTA